MRLWIRRAALLTPLLGLSVVCGSELKSKPALPPQPVSEPVQPFEKNEGSCGAFGTSVEFVDTPSAAAARAKKEEKLVFVLHVSGNFEDPRFT